MLMLLTRLVLRNALALGSALERTVMLPRLWALCERTRLEPWPGPLPPPPPPPPPLPFS